eukprot:237813-Rhodomonas_salina.1
MEISRQPPRRAGRPHGPGGNMLWGSFGGPAVCSGVWGASRGGPGRRWQALYMGVKAVAWA